MSSTIEHPEEDAIQTAKMFLILLLSVIGTIGNIFIMLAIALEDNLKKAGNTFIMNVALADLLIASIFMPASVITLANKEEAIIFCNIRSFLAGSAFLTTVISLAVQALENYVRLCRPTMSSRVNMQTTATISTIVWFVAIVVTALLYTFDLSFDFCTNKSNGDDIMTLVTSLVVLFALLFTFLIHMRMSSAVKRITNAPNFDKDSYDGTDLSLARTNFYSFLIFVTFWLPFAVVFYYQRFAEVTNEFYYATAWIGLSKSCFHNVIYCIKIDNFRNVYARFPDYCCNNNNKTTLAHINSTYAYQEPLQESSDDPSISYRYHRGYRCRHITPEGWDKYNKYSYDLQRQERRKERRNEVNNEIIPFRVPMPIPCLNICREVD